MLKNIAVCFVGLVTTDRVGKRRNRIIALAGKLQAVFSSFLEASTTLLALNPEVKRNMTIIKPLDLIINLRQLGTLLLTSVVSSCLL
jgi:hypothetical protein